MFIYTHWELLKYLTLRDIKARYQQSFLGLFWIILNPFFQMLIMSFVFQFILRFGDLGVPLPIFLFVGLLPWSYLATMLSLAMTIIMDNSSLITKVYFPRQILIVSGLLAKAFDFFVSAIIFVLLMVWFNQPFNWHMLYFFPIFLAQVVFMYGLSLILSVLNLLYRDVQYLFSLLLTLWFYLTPVIYLVDFFPEHYKWIFRFNPMSVFINAYREVLIGQGNPNWSSLLIGAGISILLVLIGDYIFRKSENIFADVV